MKIITWKFWMLGSLMSVVPVEAKAGGGGGSESEEPVAASEASTEEPEAPAEATLVDRVLGSIQSKGTLLSERNQFRERAETAEAELARVKAELATANTELTTLREDQKRISEALTNAESEKATVSEEATEQLASLGVKTEELAEVAKGGSDDFEARYEAAVKAGPRALGTFMKENKAEVREYLRKANA